MHARICVFRGVCFMGVYLCLCAYVWLHIVCVCVVVHVCVCVCVDKCMMYVSIYIWDHFREKGPSACTL